VGTEWALRDTRDAEISGLEVTLTSGEKNGPANRRNPNRQPEHRLVKGGQPSQRPTCTKLAREGSQKRRADAALGEFAGPCPLFALQRVILLYKTGGSMSSRGVSRLRQSGPISPVHLARDVTSSWQRSCRSVDCLVTQVSMNLRRAGALALVGWYLMAPPVVSGGQRT
jgi:hypothetical protein